MTTEYHQRPSESCISGHSLEYHNCDPETLTIEEICANTPYPKGQEAFSSVHIIRTSTAPSLPQLTSDHEYILDVASLTSPMAEYKTIFSLASQLILEKADRASLIVFIGAEATPEYDGFSALIAMLPFRGLPVALLTFRNSYDNLLALQTPSSLFQIDASDAARMGMYPVKAVFGSLPSQTFTATVSEWQPIRTNEDIVDEIVRLPFKIGNLELPMYTFKKEFVKGVERLIEVLVGYYTNQEEEIFPVVCCGETIDKFGYAWEISEGLRKSGHEGWYFAHRSGEIHKCYMEYSDEGMFAAIHKAKMEGKKIVFLAVGGGVDGNCVGVVTALTGADFIEIPTTPMHYNDATTSAKQAFSLVVDEKILSKNILGAFYLPKLVFCINETFLTCSSSNIHAVVGEATKTMNMLGIADSEVGQRDYHNILGACEFASDFTKILMTVQGFEEFIEFIESEESKTMKSTILDLGAQIAEIRLNSNKSSVEPNQLQDSLTSLTTKRANYLASFFTRFNTLPYETVDRVQDFLTTINLEIVKAKAMFLAHSDPFEKYRALLFEYAHTLGHGVEATIAGLIEKAKVSQVDYAHAVRLHGQCVGMAVLWAGYMSFDLDLLKGKGLQAHQSLVYLFNRFGGFDFSPVTDLCRKLDVTKEEFVENVLCVVRRDNKRGYCQCAGNKSVDQLVCDRPGKMIRSYDPKAELRYLVEVNEEWQGKVLGLAFDGEFDCFADMKKHQGERVEQNEVVFRKREEGKRTSDASIVAENVRGMIKELYDLEHKHFSQQSDLNLPSKSNLEEDDTHIKKSKMIKASELYSVCLQVAKAAGDIARITYMSGELNTKMKGENDPVTQADLDAQMMVEATLQLHFPGICTRGEDEVPMTPERALKDCNLSVIDEGILPEEFRQLPMDWITIWIDPIDGTNNYVTGDLLGVTALIGVCLDSTSIFGIIHHPFDDERPSYYGGPGVTLHKTLDPFTSGGVPAIVQPPQLEPTVLSTRMHDNPQINNYMERLPLKIVKCGGTGLKCTYVALGVHTAYIYPTSNTKKWDTAGPEAILKSVGGFIVDMNGKNYQYHEDVDKINRDGLICSKDLTIMANAVEEYAKTTASDDSIVPC